MTIYNDGVKREDVELPKDDVRKMHKLMLDKGFVLKKTSGEAATRISIIDPLRIDTSKTNNAKTRIDTTTTTKRIVVPVAEDAVEEAVNDSPSQHMKQKKQLRLTNEKKQLRLTNEQQELAAPPDIPQMSNLYVASPIAFCAIFFVLRSRRKRRLQRHTV